MYKLLFRYLGIFWLVCLVFLMMFMGLGTGQKRMSIAYVEEAANGERAIILHDLNSNLRVSLAQEAYFHQVAWSPDAESLFYIYGYTGRLRLGRLQLASTELETISNNYHYFDAPEFSPDGQQALYNQENGSVGVSISYLNLETGIHRNLISLNPFDMAWLPDNRHVLLRADFTGIESRYAILDSQDISSIQYLPTNLNLYERLYPLPDGERVILLSAWELAILYLNEEFRLESLHNAHEVYTHLALAPDGQRLAFFSKPAPSYFGAWTLSVMDIESREYSILLETEGILRSLAWSPDSEWLSYSFSPQGSPINYREIYLMRPDGNNLQRVAAGRIANLGFAWRGE